RSALDLRALLEFHPSGPYPTAGIPWYAVPFGRDGLISAYQTLGWNPDIARGTLRLLASYQGHKVDDFTEEEPGKIFHELRRGEDGRRRPLRDRRRPHARRSPPRRGERAADPLRARLLDGSRAVLRAGARRRQEAGPGRDEQRRARPLVRDREPRARRRPDEAPHGARHVHRVGHPDALEQVPDVQPDELPQRIGVAARQLAHRSGLRALRSARGGGRGGGRVDRGRPPLSERAASRALVRFPAGSPVLVAAGRLPRVLHPAGLVRGDGLSLPA